MRVGFVGTKGGGGRFGYGHPYVSISWTDTPTSTHTHILNQPGIADDELRDEEGDEGRKLPGHVHEPKDADDALSHLGWMVGFWWIVCCMYGVLWMVCLYVWGRVQRQVRGGDRTYIGLGGQHRHPRENDGRIAHRPLLQPSVH